MENLTTSSLLELGIVNILKSNNSNNVHYTAVDPAVFEGGEGCDGHPNQQTQLNIADSLQYIVSQLLQ